MRRLQEQLLPGPLSDRVHLQEEFDFTTQPDSHHSQLSPLLFPLNPLLLSLPLLSFSSFPLLSFFSFPLLSLPFLIYPVFPPLSPALLSIFPLFSYSLYKFPLISSPPLSSSLVEQTTPTTAPVFTPRGRAVRRMWMFCNSFCV